MRYVVAAGVASLALGLTTAAGPVDAGKLLGAWELTKVEGQAQVPYWRVEFLKDGKLRMTAQKGGEELKVEGTYALKKDRLTLTVEEGGKTTDTRTVTVQKLTDAVLVIVDNNKKMEFKRAK
jgi:uncharacterized protein (TIGR03066 family)